MTMIGKTVALLFASLTVACSSEAPQAVETKQRTETVSTAVTAAPDQRADYETWKAKRIERLKADGGWLSLTGLFWLEEGTNHVGAASDNEIRLPSSAPGRIGSIEKKGEKSFFVPSPNGIATIDGKPATTRVELLADVTDKPTVVQVGSTTFQVIERGGRFGVRVKDSNAETRTKFQGLDYFPYNEALRVEAKFVPYDPPREIQILNVLNMLEPMKTPGALMFKVGGNEYRLDPVLEDGETDWFIIFGDSTNGKETYGAGRYVYAAPPDASGKTIIDFNRAYNPPCAFTAFATCPLPPRQNKLMVAIEAGEKTYKGAH
jgi:uncharacterized protein